MAVVSPHLDDAVLSLGASIRAATRRGTRVDVVTVLAGDPHSTEPADPSGMRAGFTTAGDAARCRREEDRVACAIVGAEPQWLPLSDSVPSKPSLAHVASRLRPLLESYDAVLLPGGPLVHADHRLVSRAALDVLGRGVVVGLYLEQPYASWDAVSFDRNPRVGRSPADAVQRLGLAVAGEPTWHRHVGRPRDWWAKTRSMGAHASQIRVLRRAPRTRILLYEALHGGEAVLWLTLR